MAIGSIINLGGGGGSISGAKGVIICDTSTMTVGDTIRVRDVYDSQNVQNKQVITVGTPVIFEVEPYCYYKICMVQTIGDTPTEIGGVYSTVDLGQTLFMGIADFDKHSLAYIQSVLNEHNENYVLNIGDEVTIKINDGGTPKDWAMQVGAIDLYDSHEAILVSKNVYQNTQLYTSASDYYYTSTIARTNAQAFYSNIDEQDKQFIKKMTKQCHIASYNSSSSYSTFEDFVWIPTCFEVVASYPNGHTPSITQKQFPIFTTASNRIKTYNGSATSWWTCDGLNYQDSLRRSQYISSAGALGNATGTTSYGLLPCFRLTADS